MRATRFPARSAGPEDRLLDFLAHLRLNGLALGPPDALDALAALGAVAAAEPREARLALQAVCARDADTWARFDSLYDAFWFNSRRERTAPAPDARQERGFGAERTGLAGPEGVARTAAGDDAAADGSGESRLVAARTENLASRDLRAFTDPADVASAERIAEAIARAIRDRRSRRRRADRRGAELNLRRTLRASLARGGEPLDLFRRRRPDRPMRITALLDVSGSMTVHARVFLAFLKGLVGADTATDAYLFHIRLVRVTEALRDHDTLRAATRLSLMAQGFGGGTRIAAALETFNAQYAAGAVNRRTLVLILSDGYDTDPPERLAAALLRLRRRAGRIVWLNPLLGWRDLEPAAAGMRAALPHLDACLAADTLDRLAALEAEFAKV